ncbi:hypothetical protein OROGR_023687 [Orobanche gracilis]
MARFSVDGDDDANEEGPSNNRRLLKKRRTSDLIVDSQKKAAASTSNSGERASNSRNPTYTSDDLRIPLVRESRPEKPANPLLFDDELVPPTFSRSKSKEEDEEEERMVDVEEDEEEYEEEDMKDGGEEIEHDVEEVEMKQPMGSRDRLQPTEARVSSTPNGNGNVTELVEHREDAPAPLFVTLTDPDVLDCPICFEPLNLPVYQLLKARLRRKARRKKGRSPFKPPGGRPQPGARLDAP